MSHVRKQDLKNDHALLHVLFFMEISFYHFFLDDYPCLLTFFKITQIIVSFYLVGTAAWGKFFSVDPSIEKVNA